jgi:ABC-2 type transport system permease protein
MSERRHFWSNVGAVAYKEAAILRHDKPFLGVVFVQPIMMFTLFAVAISNKPANVPWAVLDRSQSAASRRFVEEIGATGYFLAPRAVARYEDGRTMLRDGKTLAFLVVDRDFARDLARGQAKAQLLLDGADPLSAARVGGYVAQVGAAFRPADLPAARAGPPRGNGLIDLRQRFWFNPTLRDREFFLAGLAAMLLTNLCLSATSLALVGERENGTYEQMLALPTTPVEIVLGKLVPYVVLSYLELLIALVPAGILFDYWPRGSWLTLFAVTLPFVLASLAIGTFVSAIARNSAQSVFLSVFFIMPSFVLSGVMMPYQLMPDGVRHIGGLLPLRWYQIALRRVIERGAGPAEVAIPALALTTIFAVALALVVWRMKPRLA